MSRTAICLVGLSVLCTMSSPYAMAQPSEPTSNVEYPFGGSLSNIDATGFDSFSGSLNVELGDDTGDFYWVNSMTFNSGDFSASYNPILELTGASANPAATQPVAVDVDVVSFDMETTGLPTFGILSLDGIFSNLAVLNLSSSASGVSLPEEDVTITLSVNSPLEGSISIGQNNADFVGAFIGLVAIPEPSAIVLATFGLLSLSLTGGRRRRR